MVDISTAWDQVVSALAEEFPDFHVEAGEDASRDTLKLPAILVDLTELEPHAEGNNSTDQWPCLVHFRAQVVFGFRATQARRAVARAAGALAAFVHQDRLGVQWGGGMVIDCGPDQYSPRADNVEIWGVEWVHETDLGPRFETEDGEIPTEPLFSYLPDTGPDHVEDYQEVDP